MAIDDASINLAAIKGILSKEFDVRVAKSGEVALFILGSVKVDLILLDIEMPGMSGFDFVNTVREIPDVKDIPVIFVTSHAESHLIAKAYECGVKDYIKKPIDPRVVKTKVYDALRISTEG